MSFIGSAMQGVAAINAGNAERASSEAQAQQFEREAQIAGTAAKESSAERLMELRRSAGAIRAMMSARGLGADSPSAMAINAGMNRIADTNIQRERYGTRQTASNLRLAARAAQQSGRAAQTAGYLSGIGSFLQAGSSGYSAFKKT